MTGSGSCDGSGASGDEGDTNSGFGDVSGTVGVCGDGDSRAISAPGDTARGDAKINGDGKSTHSDSRIERTKDGSDRSAERNDDSDRDGDIRYKH